MELWVECTLFNGQALSPQPGQLVAPVPGGPTLYVCWPTQSSQVGDSAENGHLTPLSGSEKPAWALRLTSSVIMNNLLSVILGTWTVTGSGVYCNSEQGESGDNDDYIVMSSFHWNGDQFKEKKSVKEGVCYDGNKVWCERIVSELKYALFLIGWMFLSQEE